MNINAKIELKDIDFNKIKDFLKKKEFLVITGIVVFIIAVIVTGNILFSRYSKAVEERNAVKAKYEKIISGNTDINSLKELINEADNELDANSGKFEELSQKDIVETLAKIQKETGITWSDRSFVPRSATKDAPDIKSISVTIPSFSGSYTDVKNFITYIDNFERTVTIDAFSFGKDKLTGKMKGKMTLTFYMKNVQAT